MVFICTVCFVFKIKPKKIPPLAQENGEAETKVSKQ